MLFSILPSASAQSGAGNIYGTLTDDSGGVLSGANVRLSGASGSRNTTTDSNGAFRFMSMDHGIYRLTVALAGFVAAARVVRVETGESVTVPLRLQVAGLTESVNVTAETSTINPQKTGTATTISALELSSLPNSRDPWAVLRDVPGVILDRVNIGGSENGSQAGLVSKGDNGDNAVWNLDGVLITDMASLSSPTYYDFDAFDEFAVSTGGNSAQTQTGGISISITMRRGTNAFHGSVHGYIEDHNMESENIPGSLVPAAQAEVPSEGSDSILGDHLQELSDYGAELGGPIVKDKLWFYGSWGRQDIRQWWQGIHNRATLTAYNGKINWQPSASDMISVFYFNGEKAVAGRSPGSGLIEEQGVLWNQQVAYDGGFPGLIKGEILHTFSPNLFLSAKYAHYDTGFALIPALGLSQTYTFNYITGYAYGNVNQYSSVRPSQSINLDGSYFGRALNAGHELKFGFGYRKFNVTSTSTYGGNGLAGYAGGGGPTGSYAVAFRNENSISEGTYYSGYVSDTITKAALTLNVGVRYDRQRAENVASSVPANVSLPTLLPAVDYIPSTPAITWNSVSPRVGISLGLDDSRKTLVRGNVAYYASQLPTSAASQTNTTSTSSIAYRWTPTAADGGFPLLSELNLSAPILTGNINLANPGSTASPNTVDPNYGPRHDAEVIVGLDRELATNLSLGASYTWRRGTNIDSWYPLLGVTTGNYVPSIESGPGDNGYTATYYNLAPDIPLPSGTMLTNRPDYHTNYNGVEVNLVKRLSSKWMGRLGFNYGKNTETMDGPGAIQNPTITAASNGQGAQPGPQINGGILAPYSEGTGKGFINIGANWQLVANALGQLPWALEVSGSLFARQGTPLAYIFQESTSNGTYNVLTSQNPTSDAFRYPAVWDLDLHVAKTIHTGGSSSIKISVDCFNVLNLNTVTSVNIIANSAQLGQVSQDGILNPRVFRVGLRLHF
jgi:hypothetical protein